MKYMESLENEQIHQYLERDYPIILQYAISYLKEQYNIGVADFPDAILLRLRGYVFGFLKDTIQRDGYSYKQFDPSSLQSLAMRAVKKWISDLVGFDVDLKANLKVDEDGKLLPKDKEYINKLIKKTIGNEKKGE